MERVKAELRKMYSFSPSASVSLSETVFRRCRSRQSRLLRPADRCQPRRSGAAAAGSAEHGRHDLRGAGRRLGDHSPQHQPDHRPPGGSGLHHHGGKGLRRQGPTRQSHENRPASQPESDVKNFRCKAAIASKQSAYFAIAATLESDKSRCLQGIRICAMYKSDPPLKSLYWKVPE